MKELTESNISVANNNLFIAIESYLASPNKKNADRVKQLSHQLFVRAKTTAYDTQLKRRCRVPGDISTLFRARSSEGTALLSPLPDEFKDELWESYLDCWPTNGVDGNKYERFLASLPVLANKYNLVLSMPEIEIGADDYALPLLSMVEAEARIALEYSVRLIENQTQDTDRSTFDAPYIFRLSRHEAAAINTLISQMLRDKTLIPDGLIYSYDKYIERRSNVRTNEALVESSAFCYSSPEDALIRRHTSLLAAKAKSLYLRGDKNAAGILWQTVTNIKALCDRYGEENATSDNRGEFLNAIQEQLTTTKLNAVIQTPRGLGAKKIVVNFLAVIAVLATAGLASGIFAYNYYKNHCFWLQPATATESQLGEFNAMVEEQKFHS